MLVAVRKSCKTIRVHTTIIMLRVKQLGGGFDAPSHVARPSYVQCQGAVPLRHNMPSLCGLQFQHTDYAVQQKLTA